MRCALCDIIWTGFDYETHRKLWLIWLGLLALFSFLLAIAEQPVFCVDIVIDEFVFGKPFICTI